MALERLIIVKVVLIGGFFVVALAFVVKGDTWALPAAGGDQLGAVPAPSWASR